MIEYEKIYSKEEDGFEGDIFGYEVDTSKENLKNWLNSNIGDSEKIYDIIKNNVENIFILKNINVEEEYQGMGYGTLILEDLMNELNPESIILLCDISESQKENFILEKFYENNDFKTVYNYEDYPLMVYPESTALNIKNQIEEKNKLKKNFKLR